MGELTYFSIEIKRYVQAGYLRWPEGAEADNESGLGCNRSYCDLRGLDWSDVAETIEEEAKLVARLISANNMLEEYEIVDEERYEDDGAMMGLDIGVAGATAALSAAGCIPFASCNGGAFGDIHHEAYPLVAFCARNEHLPLLLTIAEAADVGLERHGPGDLLLYAQDIRQMMTFAKLMLEKCENFRELQVGSGSGSANEVNDRPDQLGLFE